MAEALCMVGPNCVRFQNDFQPEFFQCGTSHTSVNRNLAVEWLVLHFLHYQLFYDLDLDFY